MLAAESGYALANPLAQISVAAGAWQGLLAEETLDALEGRAALRTDQDGWIESAMDG